MSELRFPDLVLCAGTVLGSDVPERVKAAAEAGFDGITLWYDDYVRVKQAGLSDADLRALVRDHDLGVAEVDPLMSWVPDTSVGDAPSRESVMLETKPKTISRVTASSSATVNARITTDAMARR